MDLTRVSVVLAALNVGGRPAGRARLLPAQADLVVVDNGPTDTTTRWLPPADRAPRRAVSGATAITRPPGPSIPGRGAPAH